VSEWADEHRRLSPEASAEPGQWNTDRAPFQRAIMDAWNDPAVHTVVFMKSAQVGATEMLGNILGYIIAQDPGPTLVLQPTLEMGEAWSKDRLAPMIRDTPDLTAKIADPKSRDSGNTLRHKTFPGGHLTVVGANSPSGLASRPIRYVLADEVDRYPISAGTEGDPLSLAVKRTTTFHNRKIMIASTPTVRGMSRVEAEFDKSDQQYLHVPCPHCGEHQRLMWAQVKWPKDKPEEAHYECSKCRGVIEDKHKPVMLASGEWRPNGEFSGIRGFHINELYSPWVRWGEIATAFLRAKRMPETLRTWVNTALGETWEEQGEEIESDFLFNRQEGFEVPPEGCLVLTAGVDVQDDRLELSLMGWGPEFESWTIEHQVWWGDPGRRELWDRLAEYLRGTFRSEDDRVLRIAAVAIDSGGHFTDSVYRFVKRPGVRWYAMKGVGGIGRPLVGRPSTANKARVTLFPVGVDTAKELLFARLKIERPGPGYMHFGAQLDEEYFRQLTAEKKVERKVRGQTTYEWKKIRPRNEALDLTVLNMAALDVLNPNMQAIAEKQTDKPEPPPVKVDPIIQARQRARGTKSRGGWVNGWR
jgi:phage terminase large subunit GpA-like protein